LIENRKEIHRKPFLLGTIPLLKSIYIGATPVVTTIIIIELIAAYTYTKYIIKK